METIARPPFGTPCNGCGVCCRDVLCKYGAIIFGSQPGPCPALEAAIGAPGRSACGLIQSPGRYAPVKTALNGEKAMREAAALLTGSGLGCDSIGPEEAQSAQSLNASMRRKWERANPPGQRRRAKALWGIDEG